MFYSLIYSVCNRVSLLLITLISIQFLTVNDYGKFSYILSILTTFVVIAGAGAGVSVNLFLSENHSKEKEKCLEVLNFNYSVITIVSLVTSILFIFFDFSDFGFDNIYLFLFVFSCIVFSNYCVVTENIYVGLSEFKRLALNSLISLIISVIFSYIFISNYGLYGALLSFLFYRIINFIINLYNSIVKPNKIIIRSKTGFMLFRKVGLPSLLSSLLVAPVLVVALTITLKNTDYVSMAYFNWVYQVYLIAVFIPSALGGYFINKFAKNKLKIIYNFKKMVGLNFLFSIVLVSLLYMLKDVILGYAGSEYVENASYLYIVMMASVIFYSINSIFSSYWPVVKLTWLGVIFNILWAVIIIVVLLLNVEDKGVNALGLAFLSSYIALFVFQFSIYFLTRHKINFSEVCD